MSHRQYKNPPIEEALCEFTFGFPTPDKQLDFALPGRLQMQPSMAEYSGLTRTQNVQTIAAGQAFAVQNALFRIQLPTPDGNRIISIGTNTLAVSVLKPYEGWHNFKPRIERALRAYSAATQMEPITRVGLRYINRITSKDDLGAESLLQYLPVGHGLVDAGLVNFMQRAEYVRGDGVKLVITKATLVPSGPVSNEFLFDIDIISEQSGVSNIDEILDVVEKLHDIEHEAFEAIITDQARSLFDA